MEGGGERARGGEEKEQEVVEVRRCTKGRRHIAEGQGICGCRLPSDLLATFARLGRRLGRLLRLFDSVHH